MAGVRCFPSDLPPLSFSDTGRGRYESMQALVGQHPTNVQTVMTQPDRGSRLESNLLDPERNMLHDEISLYGDIGICAYNTTINIYIYIYEYTYT